MQGSALPWLLACPLALAARNRCSRAEPTADPAVQVGQVMLAETVGECGQAGLTAERNQRGSIPATAVGLTLANSML